MANTAGLEPLNRLLGAFFPESPNSQANPADSAAMVTPEMHLAAINSGLQQSQSSDHYADEEDYSPYKTVDEARQDGFAIPQGNTYHDSTGKDITDQVKAWRPMKTPGFAQRFFNPQGAEDENRINNQYGSIQPFAQQQNTTANQIKAGNIRNAMGALGVPPNQADPNQLADLSPGSTAQDLEGTYQAGSDIKGQVAPTRTGATIASLNAGQAQDENALQTAQANRAFGNTTHAPYVESLRLGAMSPLYQNEATEENEFANQGGPQAAGTARAEKAQAEATLTPSQTQAEMMRLDGLIKSQPFLNRALLASAGNEASMAEFQKTLIPYAKEKGFNDSVIAAYMSRYAPTLPPVAGQVTKEGAIAPTAYTGAPFSAQAAKDAIERRYTAPLAGLPTNNVGNIITLPTGRKFVSTQPQPAIKNTAPIAPIRGQSQDEDFQDWLKGSH